MSEALYAALDALGYPVARIYLDKEKYKRKGIALDTYLTYSLIVELPKHHADDDNGASESTWRIDLFTKTAYETLVKRIKTALKGADFYGISVEAETYETGTGYYHVSIECKSYEETEE